MKIEKKVGPETSTSFHRSTRAESETCPDRVDTSIVSSSKSSVYPCPFPCKGEILEILEIRENLNCPKECSVLPLGIQLMRGKCLKP